MKWVSPTKNSVLFDSHQKPWNYTFIWVVMYHWIWWKAFFGWVTPTPFFAVLVWTPNDQQLALTMSL